LAVILYYTIRVMEMDGGGGSSACGAKMSTKRDPRVMTSVEIKVLEG